MVFESERKNDLIQSSTLSAVIAFVQKYLRHFKGGIYLLGETGIFKQFQI